MLNRWLTFSLQWSTGNQWTCNHTNKSINTGTESQNEMNENVGRVLQLFSMCAVSIHQMWNEWWRRWKRRHRRRKMYKRKCYEYVVRCSTICDFVIGKRKGIIRALTNTHTESIVCTASFETLLCACLLWTFVLLCYEFTHYA